MRILVANPGTHPELLHIARWLAMNTSHDVTYVTATRFSLTRVWSAATRMLPARAARQVCDRGIAPVSGLQVVSAGLIHELAHQVFRRTFFPLVVPTLNRRNRWFQRRCSAMHQRRRFDLIFGQLTACSDVFAGAGDAVKVLNHPIAYFEWADNYLRDQSSQRPEWAALMQYQAPDPTRANILRLEVDQAEFIVAGSAFVKNSILSSFPDKRREAVLTAHYAGNFERVGTGRRTSGVRGAPLRLLFVGQVTQRKGVGDLIEALALLREDSFRLRVVGPIDRQARLLLEKSASSPYVEVLGPIPHSQVRAEMESADLLVLPSLIEGFALAAIEAMSVGLPCVLSTHTGVHEVIVDGENGFICRPGDPSSIADAVRRASQSDLHAIGISASASAESLTWPKFVSTIVSGLREGGVAL